MDWLPLALDGAVAVGTLGLAGVTVAQGRSALSRELADTVYPPLAKMTAAASSEERICEGAGVQAWKTLKETNPYLTHRMPRRIYDGLDALEESIEEIHSGLLGRVLNYERDVTRRLGRAMADQAGHERRGVGDTAMWWWSETGRDTINLLALWVAREDIRMRGQTLAVRYFSKDWYFEVLVDGYTVTKEKAKAVAFADETYAALESDQLCRLLRDKAQAAAKLARDVAQGLEHERWGRLRRRTRHGKTGRFI